MANHSTINNLRMLNPHKFATYQFMKQYFSVSPYMFMNFTNPTDPLDYSYNDIIHMIEPFTNEFMHREKFTGTESTGPETDDDVNLPNKISQYNNNIARNNFNIVDHFGYYDNYTAGTVVPSGSTNMSKVDFHGSMFAAFIPVYTINRLKLHSSIAMALAGDNRPNNSPTRQVYGYNFYNNDAFSGYLCWGGYDLGVGSNSVHIDTATPFKRTSDVSRGGISYHTYLMYPNAYNVHRVENVNTSLVDNITDSVGKTLILTKNTTLSVFKSIDELMNGNLRNNVTEIEKSFINATKLN